jgi:hypothetical protein
MSRIRFANPTVKREIPNWVGKGIKHVALLAEVTGEVIEVVHEMQEDEPVRTPASYSQFDIADISDESDILEGRDL